jgi:hypothetical protein
MRKNIFVLGLEHFNLAILESMPRADEYEFIGLLDYEEIVRPERVRLPESLAKAEEQLVSFSGSVDAIVGYWDFPTSSILPLLRRRFGLPTTSLEAVLKCEHKYWSRLEQQRAVAEHVPRFCAFDPFDDDPLSKIDLEFPFWIKPIKAHSSYLGFKIRHREDFQTAIRIIRDKIDLFGEPFNQVLSEAALPPEIAGIGGYHCIAEAVISAGRQCTLEGYALGGEVEVYGVIDSVREGEHRSSFSRYQYPSRLPRRVQERMVEAARRLVLHIGYDGSPFNVEFYWNDRTDEIALLEINARISKSHCPLFEEVDGSSHQQVMIDIALRQRPRFPRRKGCHRLAGKFMLRVFHDGIVARVPDATDIRRLRTIFPDARVRVIAHEGMRLSELRLQDSYSFEVAEIFLGARDQKQLLENYRRAVEVLNFRFEPLRPEAA